MRILLLGANGRTGREVIRAAMEEQHEVSAVVRAASRLEGVEHHGVRVRVGDPCSASALREWLPGHDVVISVLGPRWPTRDAARVYEDSATALVDAMRASAPRRLIVTSSALLFPTRSWAVRLMSRMVTPIVSAARRMEGCIRESHVDWTIARTSFLSNDLSRDLVPVTEAEVEKETVGAAVPRAAVGRFLVSEAARPRYVKQVIGLFGGTPRADALAASSALDVG